VDFAAGILRVPGEIAKSGRARAVPLNDVALAALRELEGRAVSSGRVLSGAGCAKATLSKKFGAAAAAAGIEGVTLHTLRHTFATRLKDAGVDPFTVRDLLGHATIQMTNRYTHATPETMRRGVASLAQEAIGCAGFVPRRLRESA
jgi:integrase